MSNLKTSQESAASALGGTEKIRAVQSAADVYLTPAQLATYAGTFGSSVSVNAQTGTTYTIVSGDRSKLVTLTNGASIAVALPQAGGSFPSGWFFYIENRGSGTATITPATSTIDGAATLVLTADEGCLIASDGTNYYTMRGMGSSTSSVASDPNFSSVTGLWHFNEMINDGRHKDNSSGNRHLACFSQSALTAGVATGLATAQVKFGQYSFYTGSTVGVGVAGGSSDYTFGTGDFTMEGWFYITTLGVLQILFDTRTGGGAGVTPTVYINASNKVVFHQNNADRITGTTNVSANAWHHVASSRVSGSTYLYLDGAQEGSTYTDSNDYVGASLTIGIGTLPSSPVLGYIDECRVTKGVGRYSGASLTVPSTAFGDS